MPALPAYLYVFLARHEDKDVPRSTRQMDLQGLFHCSLHIILLWGLKGIAQVTDANNLTCPVLCARLYHIIAWLLLLNPSCPPQSTVHPGHNPPRHNRTSLCNVDHTLLKRISTGKVRPGMWKIGTFPKKEANLSASMVAEVTTSFRSERRATT